MKLGFICEGETEKKIVESPAFQQFLNAAGHTCLPKVLDATGVGNLLPKHLPQFSNLLLADGAEKIVVLSDLDNNACITFTKQRINAPNDHLVFIAVKQVEAWFLADSTCMTNMCGTEIQFELPERENEPFKTIHGLLTLHTGRGVGSKILLVTKALRNNFSILNAAAHPNCASAKYLVERLQQLVQA